MRRCKGHAGRINALALGRDGTTLYTAGLDGKVLVWDLAGARRLGRPFGTGSGNQTIPASRSAPTGACSPPATATGTVTLVDTAHAQHGRPCRSCMTDRSTAWASSARHAAARRGRPAASSASSTRAGGRVVQRLRGHHGGVYTPAFSADGRRMATATPRHGAPLGAPLGPSGRASDRGRPGLEDMSLSPDAATLVLTRGPDGVEVIDVATRRRRAKLDDAAPLSGFVRFTPDGRFLMASS